MKHKDTQYLIKRLLDRAEKEERNGNIAFAFRLLDMATKHDEENESGENHVQKK